jgi:alpha-L-arabinofuranosidase
VGRHSHPSKSPIETRVKTAMLVGILCLAVSPIRVNAANLTIQAGQPGKAISPDLVGVFFEDLNYAADGGLYAELIQNHSFKYSPTEQPDWHPLKFWELQKRGGGDGSVTVANMRPIHRNNPHYVLLTVRTAGDGVGLANSGFDSIALQSGEEYEASFWAYQAFMGQMWGRGDNSKPMPVTLRLESQTGDVLAQASMEIKGHAWTKHSATLLAPRTVRDARSALPAHERGGICLDMIPMSP